MANAGNITMNSDCVKEFDDKNYCRLKFIDKLSRQGCTPGDKREICKVISAVRNIFSRLSGLINCKKQMINQYREPMINDPHFIVYLLFLMNFFNRDRFTVNNCNDEFIYIYRAINLHKKLVPGDCIPHPVPFSCSWNNILQKEQWLENDYTLLKIRMPLNYQYIPLSFRDKVRNINIITINPGQYELVLYPSVLTVCNIKNETFVKFGSTINYQVAECTINYLDIGKYIPYNNNNNNNNNRLMCNCNRAKNTQINEPIQYHMDYSGEKLNELLELKPEPVVKPIRRKRGRNYNYNNKNRKRNTANGRGNRNVNGSGSRKYGSRARINKKNNNENNDENNNNNENNDEDLNENLNE